MDKRKAVAGLRRFVKRLVADGATDIATYREWKKLPANERFMNRCMGYTQLQGMPRVNALVQPFFHPELPLIGLNYTNTAHVTLHAFETGWTDGIRLCRGLIFDHGGNLVAFPFPKFFNYGEHLETQNLRNDPFIATVKQDGHLGIIFDYDDRFYITTRGSFTSNTSKIATVMLEPYQAAWKKALPKNITALVEIIHPETEVLTDYHGKQGFILIGAFNRRTYEDLTYDQLVALAAKLDIEVTPRWEGKSLSDLAALMRDLSIKDQEGFVAQYLTGDRIRVKFKFADYIGRMIGGKLAPTYIMNRLKDGSLEDRISDLPGEVQTEARAIAAKVLGVKDVVGGRKDRWQYLYDLETEEGCTDTYKKNCQAFCAWLVRTEQMPKAS